MLLVCARFNDFVFFWHRVWRSCAWRCSPRPCSQTSSLGRNARLDEAELGSSLAFHFVCSILSQYDSSSRPGASCASFASPFPSAGRRVHLLCASSCSHSLSAGSVILSSSNFYLVILSRNLHYLTCLLYARDLSCSSNVLAFIHSTTTFH